MDGKRNPEKPEEGTLRAEVRVRISRGTPFLGPGAVMVLEAVRDSGSVRAASELTGISYSKCRRIIRCAEKELGRQIVVRRQGGTGGGSAGLTPEGLRILALYREFDEKVQAFAAREFDRIRERI